MAGPVVASACHIPILLFRRRRPFGAWSPHARARKNDCIIGDSKALSHTRREIAYDWIITHCIWGIGESSEREIDEDGILEATNRAMQKAVAMLAEKITPTYLLVDGRDKFWFDYPHSSIIRGDNSEPSIAAASIIAKVTRDRWMSEQAQKFPQYGFEKHKGYGSEEHIAAIKKYGPCVLHRRTYLNNIIDKVSISSF